MKRSHSFATLILTTVLACGSSGGENDRPVQGTSTPVTVPPRRTSAPAPASRPSPNVTVANQTAVVADTVVFVGTPVPPVPSVEDERWSAENIQRDPLGFIREQIASCDRLKAKIEAQKITLTRLGKQAARTIEESDGIIARYTAFLTAAKTAYKDAEAADKWPVVVNGYQFDEEQLSDRIADALERIQLAKTDREAAEALATKVELRQRVVRAKARELASLRLRLVQQSEQVRTNAALAAVGDLSSVIGTLRDMMLEVDEDPAALSLDDLTGDDPDAKRNSAVRAFLDE